jgi:hypothetical protein
MADSLAPAGPVKVLDEPYGVKWDGSIEVPTKNAVYDKIEGLLSAGSFSGMVAIGTGTPNPPTYVLHIAPTSGATAGQTVFIQDATPTTGKTTVVIKAGADASGDLLSVQTAAGAVLFKVMGSGGVQGPALYYVANGIDGLWGAGGLSLKAAGVCAWSATTNASAAQDTDLSRISPGVIGVGTGAQGSFAGTIKATLQTGTNATTGLVAGVLAASTNASIVVTDAAGQVYRIPCII